MRRLCAAAARGAPAGAVAVAVGGNALAYFSSVGQRQRLGGGDETDGADDQRRDAGGGRNRHPDLGRGDAPGHRLGHLLRHPRRRQPGRDLPHRGGARPRSSTCKDSGLAVGEHTYKVTALWQTWSAAGGAKTANVTVGEATKFTISGSTATLAAGGLGQPHDHRQGRQQQHRHDLHRLALADLLRRLRQPGGQRPHRRQQLRHGGRLRQRHRAHLHRRRRHRQHDQKRRPEDLQSGRRQRGGQRGRADAPRPAGAHGQPGGCLEIRARARRARRPAPAPPTTSRSPPRTPTATRRPATPGRTASSSPAPPPAPAATRRP